MVLSISEEITSLEAEIANTKGHGSIQRKAELQKKIDQLKEQDKPEDPPSPVEIPAAPNVLPPYRKATMDQIKEAEKNGKLCGVDFTNMTASIKS